MNKHLETIKNIAFSMEGLAAAFRMTGNQTLADKMDTYASVLLNAKAEIELELDANVKALFESADQATKNVIEAALAGTALKEMDVAKKFGALVGAAFRSGIS